MFKVKPNFHIFSYAGRVSVRTGEGLHRPDLLRSREQRRTSIVTLFVDAKPFSSSGHRGEKIQGELGEDASATS